MKEKFYCLLNVQLLRVYKRLILHGLEENQLVKTDDSTWAIADRNKKASVLKSYTRKQKTNMAEAFIMTKSKNAMSDITFPSGVVVNGFADNLIKK